MFVDECECLWPRSSNLKNAIKVLGLLLVAKHADAMCHGHVKRCFLSLVTYRDLCRDLPFFREEECLFFHGVSSRKACLDEVIDVAKDPSFFRIGAPTRAGGDGYRQEFFFWRSAFLAEDAFLYSFAALHAKLHGRTNGRVV